MNIAATTLTSDPWRCRQAAMLFHYSSLGYLQGRHKQVSLLIDDIVDPLLDLAKQQGRDAMLSDKRGGGRNTSSNWTNNAWPMLKGMQASLARDIGLRSFGKYDVTGINYHLRSASQYSMDWASEQEEQQYQAAISIISRYVQVESPTSATPLKQPIFNKLGNRQ